MKKRIFSMLLAIVMMVGLLAFFSTTASAAQVVDSGSCGDNAGYTLYADGRLVITGTGGIWDYAFYENDKITSLEIGNGISAIGIAAFASCRSLTGTVVIPNSVTSLCGDHDPMDPRLGAFDRCTNLKNIVIGTGITEMPYGLLSSCENLNSVSMHDGITLIAPYAIAFCKRLPYVEIPAAVTQIGAMAFVNDYSLTTVVFKGNAPEMESAFYCTSFNIAGFYSENRTGWNDTNSIIFMSSLDSLTPYTTDSRGTIIPVAPSADAAASALSRFRSNYPAGAEYPDNYNYIINGNFITGYGSEAFAFQVSDALCGYLPISEIRAVKFSELNVGDVLYLNGECCTVTGISGDSITAAGVDADCTIYYDRTFTRAQVESASGVRARCGVAPYPGLIDPAQDFILEDLPTQIPDAQTIYGTIMALKETYPEGMPYSSKNHFCSQTESPAWTENGMPMVMQMCGHGCSAFAFMVSDLCFGNLPAYYLKIGDWNYDSLRVGDSLSGLGHQVVILEVHDDYVVIVEGNYDGTIHWGRTMTREEVLANYDLYTRYPDGYPFSDISSNAYYYMPVRWAVKNGITNGTSATTFSPEKACTRAQAVTFLWRAAGSPEPAGSDLPFEDIPSNAYYSKAVLWAVENGITNGTSANTFSPDANCTRAQIVTFLYRCMGGK